MTKIMLSEKHLVSGELAVIGMRIGRFPAGGGSVVRGGRANRGRYKAGTGCGHMIPSSLVTSLRWC